MKDVVSIRNVLSNIGRLIQNQQVSDHIRVNIQSVSPTVLTCIVREKLDVFKMDFAIAKNYATDDTLKMHPELDLISIQHKKTLDAIKPWPSKFVYKMNGGLSSAVVRYVRLQNDFTRSMIRITKHWYESLRLSQPNSRIMFVFLAIHCAQRENNFPTKSLLRCFMGMLTMVENFDQLDAVFRDEYKFPEHQFDEETKLPRVMDPVNPYRNFAEFYKRDTKLLLKQYASECASAIRMHSTSTALDFQLAGKVFKMQAEQSQLPMWFLDRVDRSIWLIETTRDVLPMEAQVHKYEDFANQADDYHSVVVFIKDNMNEIIDFIGTERVTLVRELRSFLQTSFRGAKISTTSSDHDNFHASVIYPIPRIGSIVIKIRFR